MPISRKKYRKQQRRTLKKTRKPKPKRVVGGGTMEGFDASKVHPASIIMK
jgi:hypothetical protein